MLQSLLRVYPADDAEQKVFKQWREKISVLEIIHYFDVFFYNINIRSCKSLRNTEVYKNAKYTKLESFFSFIPIFSREEPNTVCVSFWIFLFTDYQYLGSGPGSEGSVITGEYAVS